MHPRLYCPQRQGYARHHEYASQRFIAEDPDEERVFKTPVAVKVDDQGRIFVVESTVSRIQVYEKLGYPSPVFTADDLSSLPRKFAG